MKTKLLILTALFCCISAVASAQTVYVNSSPNATFSAYHTYAWGQNQNPNQIASSFLAQEAQNQINTQLQSKGLKLVQESENPDLIVVISGGMKHCWLWGIEKTVGDAVFKDRNEVRRHTSAVPRIGQSELSAIWRTKIMGL